MDRHLQVNRNYYLNALGFINAAVLLSDSYKSQGLMDEGHPLEVVQMWPLQYMFSLCAEMTLKAGLALHKEDLKKLRSRKHGHDLKWLLDSYEQKVGKLEWLLTRKIEALNKGEFRYTEFFGEGVAYIEPVAPEDFLPAIKMVLEKDHEKALEIINDQN